MLETQMMKAGKTNSKYLTEYALEKTTNKKRIEVEYKNNILKWGVYVTNGKNLDLILQIKKQKIKTGITIKN